jgi:hypothetical protein
MRIRLAAVSALTLALTACGGGTPTADPSDKPTKAALEGALPNVSGGTVVPSALQEFTCRRDDKGTWTASGAVVNASKKAISFQVTAHVGPADGSGAKARTKRIAAIQPKGSVRFDLGEIEAASADGPCHVQVVALDS